MTHYPRIYRLLIAAGHSPLKAAQVTLDAMRGDPWAMDWVRSLFRVRRSVL